MKIYDPLYSGRASGKHAGAIFTFNRGLAVLKKYTIPRQTHTAVRQAVKNKFSYIQKYWANDLTYEQITLWNEWNLPWTDIYGNAVLLTGINKFFICNATLLEADKPLTLIPPTETPSEITATPTEDLGFIKLSINGISDAEISEQLPFIRIETAGTPTRTEYINGQLGIFWDGIPQSRTPLEKDYKMVNIYNCREGFEGVEELKIIIQTDTSLKGLQPIRIQRFNKWGFWSGLLTYINHLSKKNLFINGDFYSHEGWSEGANFTIHDGRFYWTGAGSSIQELNLIIGHTYKITFTVNFITPGGDLYLQWGYTFPLHITTSGTYTIEKVATAEPQQVGFYISTAIDCYVDDAFIWDVA